MSLSQNKRRMRVAVLVRQAVAAAGEGPDSAEAARGGVKEVAGMAAAVVAGMAMAEVGRVVAERVGVGRLAGTEGDAAPYVDISARAGTVAEAVVAWVERRAVVMEVEQKVVSGD